MRTKAHWVLPFNKTMIFLRAFYSNTRLSHLSSTKVNGTMIMLNFICSSQCLVTYVRSGHVDRLRAELHYCKCKSKVILQDISLETNPKMNKKACLVSVWYYQVGYPELQAVLWHEKLMLCPIVSSVGIGRTKNCIGYQKL